MTTPHISSPAPRPSLPGRVRIWPTDYGWLYMLTLFGMLLGSANYGNNLGFLLTFMLFSMALASILLKHGLVKRVEIDFLRAKPVFSGEMIVFEFVLTSHTDAPGLELRFLGTSPELRVVEVDLLAGKATRVFIEARAPARGVFSPGPLRITSTQPFGLFRARRKVESRAMCLIYPAPYPEELVPPPSRGYPEKGGQGASGGPGVEEFSGLRPYAAGDAMQRIAWKSSFRGQGLLTKEFEGMAGGAHALDFDSLAPFPVEERLSRLCKMALLAHSQGEPYSLKLPAKILPPDTGERHLRTCLRELALFDTGHDAETREDDQGWGFSDA